MFCGLDFWHVGRLLDETHAGRNDEIGLCMIAGLVEDENDEAIFADRDGLRDVLKERSEQRFVDPVR